MPLIHSADGYDQMIGTGAFMRLYVLAVPGALTDTLAIEVVDQSGGSHIATLTAIVKSFVFLPAP